MGKQVKGFVLGAITGGIAALLFAPKSGRELRQKLTGKINEVSEAANEAVEEETSATQEEVSSRLQEQADEIARQLRANRGGDLTPEEASDMNQDEEIIVNVDPVTEKVTADDKEDSANEDTKD